jgi:hypothetical protein
MILALEISSCLKRKSSNLKDGCGEHILTAKLKPVAHGNVDLILNCLRKGSLKPIEGERDGQQGS